LADHIRIGSITKTWTGTVILQQAQEGKLTDPQKKVTIVVWVNVRFIDSDSYPSAR
jgi:hypothetical protein